MENGGAWVEYDGIVDRIDRTGKRVGRWRVEGERGGSWWATLPASDGFTRAPPSPRAERATELGVCEASDPARAASAR